MTLYYSIVFALLCFEMSMFMVLIVSRLSIRPPAAAFGIEASADKLTL